MTTVIVIRHGESEANRQGIFAGQINPDLLERGVEQAKLTAQYVADTYQVDAVYASDLQRAYKTAGYLADLFGLPVVQDKNFREIDGGKWEGIPFEELAVRFREDYTFWMEHVEQGFCTGGESVQDVCDRVMPALTKVAEENDGKTVAVVTHVTPIRVAQTFIETGSLEKMKDYPWVSNASVSVFQYEKGKWHVVSVSEDRHLETLKTVLPSNI